MVKDPEFPKLENPGLGTEFELNDHRGVIVGIAKVASSGLFGVPTLYTTYERALQYIPNPRFTISYVLVKPKSAADVAGIKQQVRALGYLALTKDEFMDKISAFLHVPDRPRDEPADHDGDGVYRRALHFGSDFLHLCPGESRKVRRAESHGREEPRIDSDDSVPGQFHGAHRLRFRNRIVRSHDRTRQDEASRTMPR